MRQAWEQNSEQIRTLDIDVFLATFFRFTTGWEKKVLLDICCDAREISDKYEQNENFGIEEWRRLEEETGLGEWWKIQEG